ncbi:uncharacterized protein BP5553_06874 [Venustampulla echinocandica]|uniref:Fungal-type protein kinase domain-containing protein n=1 Tax=Venustampulla echinocandica TaxID=2656787 RepID=A0A370TL52_9HELO|nr:uncharacterized protein BP5553_06874 [Venustampulla echinocandica]RDL36262.1 hypothetical protein BP5553_06874 [Venustampulla echinocandica]
MIPCIIQASTGTMQFMAVEVLEGKGHTYRHDLESFLYVDVHSIWDMDKNRFENIIAQFTAVFEELKLLARDLRNVLFPIKDATSSWKPFYSLSHPNVDAVKGH